MKTYFKLTLSLLIGLIPISSFANLGISPVEMIMENNQKATSFEITNTLDSNLSVHISILKWRRVDGKDALEETEDLHILPAIF